MRIIIISLILTTICFTSDSLSQTLNKDRNVPLKAEESLEFIAGDLQEIAITIKDFNKNIVKSYENISKSLGLNLTPNQQKLLVSFEILNRAEVRLANLQKFKIDLLEKKSKIEQQISTVETSLRDEDIQKNTSLTGTTNARELRDKRRTDLNKQFSNLSATLFEVQNMLSQNNADLIQTSQLVTNIRTRLFPAIYQELPKLNYDN